MEDFVPTLIQVECAVKRPLAQPSPDSEGVSSPPSEPGGPALLSGKPPEASPLLSRSKSENPTPASPAGSEAPSRERVLLLLLLIWCEPRFLGPVYPNLISFSSN